MAALGGGDEGRQGGGGQGRGRKSRGMGRRGQGGGGEGGQEEAGEEARGRRDVVFRPAAEPPTAMGWDSTADTTRRAGGVLPIHHRLGPRQQRGRVLRERRYGGGGEGGEGEERPDRLSPQRGLALPPTSPRPPPRRALTRAVASTATAAATAVAAPVAATAATAATVATAEMAAVTAVTASAAEALLAPLRTDARSDCRARGGGGGQRHADGGEGWGGRGAGGGGAPPPAVKVGGWACALVEGNEAGGGGRTSPLRTSTPGGDEAHANPRKEAHVHPWGGGTSAPRDMSVPRQEGTSAPREVD